MLYKFMLAALLTTIGTDAEALSDNGHFGKLVFSCATSREKSVEVYDNGKFIYYSFGRKNEKPDIALSIPRNTAKFHPWNGMGSSFSNSVEIPSGKNVVYEVVWASDRNSDAHNDESGVNVLIGGIQKASIQCVSEPQGSLVGI